MTKKELEKEYDILIDKYFCEKVQKDFWRGEYNKLKEQNLRLTKMIEFLNKKPEIERSR